MAGPEQSKQQQVEDKAEHIDDAELALQGINMLLNNGFKESDELFRKYSRYSSDTGYHFSAFLNYVWYEAEVNVSIALSGCVYTGSPILIFFFPEIGQQIFSHQIFFRSDWSDWTNE
ncbi:unnamed protein product [Coregonus sp. 'balchen']|nr:unnamed protein product [Coregonus sp. 'balchen']